MGGTGREKHTQRRKMTEYKSISTCQTKKMKGKRKNKEIVSRFIIECRWKKFHPMRNVTVKLAM